MQKVVNLNVEFIIVIFTTNLCLSQSGKIYMKMFFKHSLDM